LNIQFKPSALKSEGAKMANCKNCGFELPAGAQFCPRCGAPVSKIEEATSQPSPGVPSQPILAQGMVLAFWWERFLAWLIDVVIIGVVTAIISLITGLTFNVISGWPTWIPFFVNFNLNGVFLFLYWMFMEGSASQKGQSFGKMVMRIRVVHVDGTTINMGDAAIESIGKAFILLIDLLVGWILYPRKRQRLFNYLSRTIVVRGQ
jgi:uncharacterized RDD family membrane protein YckC